MILSNESHVPISCARQVVTMPTPVWLSQVERSLMRATLRRKKIKSVSKYEKKVTALKIILVAS